MRLEIMGLVVALACQGVGLGHAGEGRFTVRDSIGLQQFIDPDIDATDPVRKFSPDGKYFIVVTQRGLLAQDRVQSTVWRFDVAAERAFLAKGAGRGEAPQPVSLAALAGTTEFYEQTSETVAITAARWSADSRSVYFLGRDNDTEWHLYQVDVGTQHLLQLTPRGQNVAAYSVSGETVLYAVAVPFRAAPLPREVAGVGLGLTALLSPDWQYAYPNQDELWVYARGDVHVVADGNSGRPVRLNKHFDLDSVILAPSPDGRFALITQAVSSIPASWEAYEPGANVGRVGAAAPQALVHATAYEVPERFVLVDLATGETTPLVGGPLGRAISWWSGTQVMWSRDSRQVLLSNVFLPPESVPEAERRKRLSAPVVALYDIASRTATPVAYFKHSQLADPKRWRVADVSWNEAARAITLRYTDGGPAPETYRMPGSRGQGSNAAVAVKQASPPLEIGIHQNLNSAPQLYASLANGLPASKIWDPNPGLAAFDLGSAEVYNWKDRAGRLIKGVLIKPPHFDPARRYPLVIEARAYHQDRFVLDGTYATAVAARVMAADDLLVLQAGEPAAPEKDMFNGATQRALEGYETVVAQLAAEGRIDADRVAIIGFSRTCDTVLYALAHNPRLFAAATMANGLTYGPLQYFFSVDSSPVSNVAMQQWDLHYQGKPFGNGLSNFLHSNPIFSIAAVATPVRIETRGGRIAQMLTTDWEPYAALRSLDKPVDLIVLPYASHVVSMPSDIVASQEGEVDWMRFWLQGYEDRDGGKQDQYRRWEKLCALQGAQNPGRPRWCASAPQKADHDVSSDHT